MNESIPTQKEFGEVIDFEDGFQIKRFGTKDDIVAQATLVESPVFPNCYFLDDVMVYKPEDQGKGFASQLMAATEKRSRETGKPIVLNDGTDALREKQNEQSVGLYEKRSGWTRVVRADGSMTPYVLYGSQDPELISSILERDALLNKFAEEPEQ
ncbi:hypothetical protein A2851_00645 [Candidatus Kaiserbacteria bacterium RIFCSPHIGHO2_01_FULL_53_29]|uniref:N-acetyltransferase domain-containing protein n=1 Tax=Candidatus Kaiserbacteria bacterium RIFCSPHIGHO2_01_FULL_53_29 TaxID=1798480 RepID=A0A1F6CU06_9BACT|nr:MAG: hypothetical protein A2851_00645 [Candidatus Kaiserbacteria bacterium RIFCSPHIGHO2_01_FULL_53_29]